jgi:hypothetical protein
MALVEKGAKTFPLVQSLDMACAYQEGGEVVTTRSKIENLVGRLKYLLPTCTINSRIDNRDLQLEIRLQMIDCAFVKRSHISILQIRKCKFGNAKYLGDLMAREFVTELGIDRRYFACGLWRDVDAALNASVGLDDQYDADEILSGDLDGFGCNAWERK